MAETRLMLTKPITAHGAEVSELEFRAPTGGDLAQCGMPFDMLPADHGGKQGVRVNAAVVRELISRLCAIPTSSVDQMDVRDFVAATGIVGGFFAAEEKS